MALGGGGSAYLTGFEALFVNPANLYIQEKNYRFQFSLLQGGLFHDTLLPISNNLDRFSNFESHTSFFDDQSTSDRLNFDDVETIINRHYPGNRTSKEFLTEADFYWFGLKWVRDQRSYGISLRTRYANRYELGRGLFSSVPVEKNGVSIVDRSFKQTSQILHEFSFGYAESFTFLNGLLPQLSEFIIGIAPKVVMSGSYLDAAFTNFYELESESEPWQQQFGYSQQSTGSFSDFAQPFSNSGNLPTQTNKTFRDLLNPTGIGFGLDIGVTYLITFGDDLSVLRQQNQPTKKSLRLAFSITDLGAVHQYKSPFEFSSEVTEETTSQIGDPSEFSFTGSPNEHYFFLSELEEFSDVNFSSQNENNFDTLLPTSIQTGALFQYQRIKLMGDLSYSISESPFIHSRLASFIGMELRPFSFLPIRGGTRFARRMSGYYSFGTGVETDRFDLNLSILLKTKNVGPTSEMLGISMLGLTFYFE